jgi:predicted nicotinamide N-methyase
MTRLHPDDGLPAGGQSSIADIRAFITANLHLRPAPALPDILIYTAHPASGLSRLGARNADNPPPYWAYGWAGGTVLAHHLFSDPECVRGRRVVDLGAGAGIVAIAAAKCGAASVAAADIDLNAIAAIGLNAEANAVTIDVRHADFLSAAPPDVDIILAGDVFYEESLAARMLGFLRDCRTAGIDVLIGDPRRTPLPQEKLRLVAEYPVPDFGYGSRGGTTLGGIFAIDLAG